MISLDKEDKLKLMQKADDVVSVTFDCYYVQENDEYLYGVFVLYHNLKAIEEDGFESLNEAIEYAYRAFTTANSQEKL